MNILILKISSVLFLLHNIPPFPAPSLLWRLWEFTQGFPHAKPPTAELHLWSTFTFLRHCLLRAPQSLTHSPFSFSSCFLIFPRGFWDSETLVWKGPK